LRSTVVTWRLPGLRRSPANTEIVECSR